MTAHSLTKFSYCFEAYLAAESKWQVYGSDSLRPDGLGYPDVMGVQDRENSDPEAHPTDIARRLMTGELAQVMFRCTLERSLTTIPSRVRIRLWTESGSAQDPAVMIEARPDELATARVVIAAQRHAEAEEVAALMASQFRCMVRAGVASTRNREKWLDEFVNPTWTRHDIDRYLLASSDLEEIESSARNIGLSDASRTDPLYEVSNDEILRLPNVQVVLRPNGDLLLERTVGGPLEDSDIEDAIRAILTTKSPVDQQPLILTWDRDPAENILESLVRALNSDKTPIKVVRGQSAPPAPQLAPAPSATTDRGAVEDRVTEALRTQPGKHMSVPELALLLDLPHNRIRPGLIRLMRFGQVQRVRRGRYALAT